MTATRPDLSAPAPTGAAGSGAPPDAVAPAPLLSSPALGHFPPAASARALLRRGLPVIYQESPDPFAMRFLEALERVLDPRVAVIDGKVSYIERDIAPENMVCEMARWLGLEPEELPAGAARAMLGHASELARLRGTLAGLQLALGCCFPDLHLSLHDSGGVGPVQPSNQPDGDAGLVVRCREALDRARQAELERIIRRQLPVHVGVTVRTGDLSVPREESS